MFSRIDNHHNFLRPNYTLASATEAFLGPVVAMLSLYITAIAYNEQISPRHVMLGILAFSILFPGKVSLQENGWKVFKQSTSSWLIAASILFLFGYSSGYIQNFSPAAITAWAISVPFFTLASFIICKSVLFRLVNKDANQRKALIAGANEIGLRIHQQFNENPYLGVKVVGFFDDRSPERLPEISPTPILGKLPDIAEYVKQHKVDHIYIALPMASQPRILNLLDELKDTTASIFFVPDIFVTDLIQGQLHSVGNTPVVAVCETPFTGFCGLEKRLSDIVISIILLILLSPVMLILAVGVKLSSPGPIIFKQRRYGLDGHEILVYKFRSMTTCDNGPVVQQATKNDNRITPFGAFIRKTSLDELPQFVNVLQGRMSIVGPRPHAVAHNETYRKLIKGYMVRHKVKPGITGWAQVSGYRGETETIDKMEKRIEYDIEYLRNWSLKFDLWIIYKTVAVVLKDKNAY